MDLHLQNLTTGVTTKLPTDRTLIGSADYATLHPRHTWTKFARPDEHQLSSQRQIGRQALVSASPRSCACWPIASYWCQCSATRPKRSRKMWISSIE